MIPKGKGVYVWRMAQVGGPEQLLVHTKKMGLNWVAIKIADGKWKYWHTPDWIDEAVRLLKAEGITVGGWHYLYHTSVSYARAEAAVANKEVERLRLDFYSMDPEGEAKGKHAEAAAYVNDLSMPDVGLCSYRYPDLHSSLPWDKYLLVSTFHQPQVYWLTKHNPGQQLEESEIQLSALADLPFCALGSAYHSKGWEPTLNDLREFDRTAGLLGHQGVGYWSMDYMHQNQREDWMDEIASHQGWSQPNPPVFSLEEKVNLLWEAHPELHHG